MRNTNMFVVDGNVGFVDSEKGYFTLYSNADYYSKDKGEYVTVANSFSISAMGRMNERIEGLNKGDLVSVTCSIRSFYDKENEKQNTYYNLDDVRMIRRAEGGEKPSRSPAPSKKTSTHFEDDDW